MKEIEIQITECPRDAMQGYHNIFPTDIKVKYINSLLNCGFDTLDIGSFVSPKAVPQMADTQDVLNKIKFDNSDAKTIIKTNDKTHIKLPDLLVIAANKKGIDLALNNENIKYIGYPFSISETFQLKNTNSTIEETFEIIKNAQDKLINTNKELNIYISMGFGNNYDNKSSGNIWDFDIVGNWVDKLNKIGIANFAIADTIGIADDERIFGMANFIKKEFSNLNIGFHLHSSYETSYSKIDAAISGGITKFDTAINGFGGCPFAEDGLVGNIATEILIKYLKEKNIKHNINIDNFEISRKIASEIFI